MSINQTHATHPGFDRTALQVNQAAMIALLLVAFVADLLWPAAITAIITAPGALSPSLAPFQQLYRDVLRPAGLLKPDIHQEDAAPHRFAQGMGATVLFLASLALFLGAPTFGWVALLVVALAVINLVFGFCVGCFIFFQIQRLT
ncbi:MAG: DUF4395 domain-containing protein [Roseiflexus sp.]